MRVEVTKEVEPIEISDDESESDDVQIIDNCEEAAPSGPAATAAPGESDDPELEAALAGLDADTEKQVHNVIQELNKHVEADMWKLAYEEANEENKVWKNSPGPSLALRLILKLASIFQKKTFFVKNFFLSLIFMKLKI